MNIHGFCPFCNIDLDGELIIDTFINKGYSLDKATTYASMYAGWDEYGEANRWSRVIGAYRMSSDRTKSYHCPDCNKTWERD